MSIQVKDGNGVLQTVNTLPGTGQTASANSLPVVIASDQSAIAVSASALPLPSGAATAANQTSAQSAPGASAGTAITVQGAASGVAVPVSLSGVVQVNAYGATPNRVTYSGAIATAASTTAITGQGAGEFTYVTDVDLFNAGSYSFLVEILNSASTVLWQALAPAGGGVCKAFETPIGGNGQMTANTALSLQASYVGTSGSATISSGTYNSSTGVVSLTLSANAPFTAPETLAISGLTGTGAFASLDGAFTATSASGTTVTYQGPTGLGTVTITGGSLAYSPVPNLYANLNGYKSTL